MGMTGIVNGVTSLDGSRDTDYWCTDEGMSAEARG